MQSPCFPQCRIGEVIEREAGDYHHGAMLC